MFAYVYSVVEAIELQYVTGLVPIMMITYVYFGIEGNLFCSILLNLFLLVLMYLVLPSCMIMIIL